MKATAFEYRHQTLVHQFYSDTESPAAHGAHCFTAHTSCRARISFRVGKGLPARNSQMGLFLTMVVFVITLKDRLAEVLAAASFLIGLLLNAPIFSRAPNVAE
jgi:hypothetical protein